MTAPEIPDFTLSNEGSLSLLTPKSEAAQSFVDAHVIYEDYQLHCDAIAIEHRYVADIVAGARAHGLTVEEQ